MSPAGLIEMPPVSNVMPLPTSTTGFAAFAATVVLEHDEARRLVAAVGDRQERAHAELLDLRALGDVERPVDPERERGREQPLDDPLVHVPGQRDPLREPPGALPLAGSALDREGQCRQPRERLDQAHLLGADRDIDLREVGDDHAEPLAAGLHGRAGQRLPLDDLGVTLGDVPAERTGDDHHAVLREGALRDRRLVEGALDPAEQVLVDPVAAGGKDRLIAAVPGQEHGPHERSRAADGRADAVVEVTGTPLEVDAHEQVDQGLLGLDPRSLSGGGYDRPLPPGRAVVTGTPRVSSHLDSRRCPSEP